MKKQKTPAPPEIHLQDALIPEAEQPYKVPENWVWTKFTRLQRKLLTAHSGVT